MERQVAVAGGFGGEPERASAEVLDNSAGAGDQEYQIHVSKGLVSEGRVSEGRVSERQVSETQEQTNRCGYFNPYVDSADHRATVLIGKDTRLSGYMIESALVAGLVAQGANVIMLGPIPTPAIAVLVRSLRADVGIMISASHNPYYDNGIKFFDSNGVKFSKEMEARIEAFVPDPQADDVKCGKSIRLDDAAGRYVEFAKSTFPKKYDLSGVKIVLDCANGAAYKVAPRIFWELGATVIAMADEPNGRNINDGCGALHPSNMLRCVQDTGADIGIALDGDADRLLIATPGGQLVNGDQVLALIAKSWSARSEGGAPRLTNGVVSTCMSNLGLKKYLQSLGISHFEAPVGDKNVVDLMRQTQSNLGGEESGHVILSDYTTTGDGIIAALQVLAIAQGQGQGEGQRQGEGQGEGLGALRFCLDDIFPVYTPCPQKTVNFSLVSGISAQVVDELTQAIANQLGSDGHVVVRRSGTEPVVRVMIQHPDLDYIQHIFDHIVAPALAFS
jgi:phosphoglucosamine mutase